jgi:hypothetical protein
MSLLRGIMQLEQSGLVSRLQYYFRHTHLQPAYLVLWGTLQQARDRCVRDLSRQLSRGQPQRPVHNYYLFQSVSNPSRFYLIYTNCSVFNGIGARILWDMSQPIALLTHMTEQC